jgi:NAD(P)-dependent dehydrogenase (short-subunit alcohol dehydrogenase family)
MQDKPVALVTGANKGIGRQTAKDLAAHRFTMLVGSRNPEHEETAAKSVGVDARTPSSSTSRIRAPSHRGGAHPEHAGGTHRQRIKYRRIAHMELERDDPHSILKDQAVMIGGHLNRW